MREGRRIHANLRAVIAYVIVQLGDVVRDRLVFFFFGAEDNVGIFKPEHRLVGWDYDDLKLVDLFEFRCFSFSSAGHAAELLIEAEVVLK